jgi:hypothetical protein
MEGSREGAFVGGRECGRQTTISTIYNPPEHLAMDEVNVLLEGRIIFKQYIPMKHKHFI